MPRIPEDEIERLKRQTDLAAAVRARGIELKPHGRKDLIGKCPFHADERPSFVVSPDKNLFHCMGCDAAGSVIDFVMKADGLDFRAAVDALMPGLRGGAATPQARRAPEKPAPTLPPERASQLLERVAAIYEKTFAEVPEGRAYLEGRGITDAGLFTRHRVGYAAGTLKDLLPKDGPLKEELKALGVLLDNGHERFAGCVVFPVFDPDGRIATLYGRFTGAGPKRHLFLPERSTGLWNAAAVKTYPEIILVEAVIDALSVTMAGRHNVMAIQGTNGFSDADLALCRAHGVRRVMLLMDGDEAGGKAAARLRPRLAAEGMDVAVKALPAEHDPNSYLVEHGAEKLAAFLASDAWTPNEMRDPGMAGAAVQPARDGHPAATAGQTGLAVAYGLRRYEIRGLEKGQRRLKATVRVEHAGKLHVDTLDFYSARSRRILAQDLCRVFEEAPETIEADLDKLLRHCEQLPERTVAEGEQEGRPAETLMTPRERAEAQAFGKSPDLVQRILADFETCGVIGEESNKLLGYVAMTSRKRDVPLSVLILSSSGAGKTALQDAVVGFCPPEDLVKLTSLSGKALFYKDRLSLKHKVLALAEGDGAQEASYAIRNLISARELVSESTIKDLATGRLTTMENKVEGPSAVFLTTTNPETDPETRSRFFVTSVDESREQTRRIMAFQRRLQLSDGPIASAEIDAVLRRHRNFQRLLQPVAVKNPYADQLTYGDDRLQGRRDQPKYLNLIKAVAFLRQMQKEVRTEQRNGAAVAYILADLDDIRLANRLAHEILGHSLDELSRPGQDLLMLLDEMVESIARRIGKEQRNATGGASPPGRPVISFSRREVREFTGWTNTRLHIHLKELADFEYAIVDAGRNGLPFRYRLAYEGQGKDGRRFMLGLHDADTLKLVKG